MHEWIEMSCALSPRLPPLGSFAAVAQSRNIDASSVSRAIAALEARIGVRLFQRTTRSMKLTEAGAHYLAKVVSLVDEIERVEAEVRGLTSSPRGTLRLTASVSFGQSRIVPLLSAFRTLYPALRVECLFTDVNVDLVAERIDLAVRLAPAIQGDLIASKLIDTHYRVVASPAYLAEAPRLKRPSDLTSHRCLLLNLREFPSRWLFRDKRGLVEEVAIDGDYVIEPVSSLRDAAVAGLRSSIAERLAGRCRTRRRTLGRRLSAPRRDGNDLQYGRLAGLPEQVLPARQSPSDD